METEFFCPRCNLSLKEVRMSHGVFWTCDKCGGRAVGLELLRRTFTPESINPLWRHTISGEGKVGPRCPSCRRPMIDVALSENAAVNVMYVDCAISSGSTLTKSKLSCRDHCQPHSP